MVAWHEMPGRRTPNAPSRRDGMIGLAQPNSFTCTLNPMMYFESDRPSDHTVPYGTGRSYPNSPGISCQATITPSLRD